MYRNQLVPEERARIGAYESTFERQPFMSSEAAIQDMTAEQMAYALGQVTANNVLPSLTLLENGYELLEYRVNLRETIHADLVSELVKVLESDGADLHWNQVDVNSYLCVIGAGVAACIDTTPGQEQLSLRYANTLVSALHNAHRAEALPRSLLFLQTTLYERFDALLAEVRRRTWYWMGK
jgi:hypothetical protein